MQKLLFISVSCCPKSDGQIYPTQFDYVLSDDQYNIIKSETLELDVDYIKTQKYFKGLASMNELDGQDKELETLTEQNFQKIVELLKDKENLVFGFGCTRNIEFLVDYVTEHNNESLRFTYYDALEMIYAFYPERRKESSYVIFEHFGGQGKRFKDLKLDNYALGVMEVVREFEEVSALKASEIANKFDSMDFSDDSFMTEEDEYGYNENFLGPYVSEFNIAPRSVRVIPSEMFRPKVGDYLSEEEIEQLSDDDLELVSVDLSSDESDDERLLTSRPSQKIALDSSIILNNSLTEDVLNTLDHLGYTSVDLVGQCDILLCLDHKSKKEFIEQHRNNKHRVMILTLCEFMSSLS